MTLEQLTQILGDIALQLPAAQERFMAQWLESRTLSAEARAVLDAGQAVWRLYMASLGQLRTSKFRIDTWDAGWWQVRSALKDRELGKDELAAVKAAHDALRDKLRPQLAGYGFIDDALLPTAVQVDAEDATS